MSTVIKIFSKTEDVSRGAERSSVGRTPRRRFSEWGYRGGILSRVRPALEGPVRDAWPGTSVQKRALRQCTGRLLSVPSPALGRGGGVAFLLVDVTTRWDAGDRLMNRAREQEGARSHDVSAVEIDQPTKWWLRVAGLLAGAGASDPGDWQGRVGTDCGAAAWATGFVDKTAPCTGC